jgi:hypothetical protein
MAPCHCALSTPAIAAVRLLADHLDLFTACNGGAGLGGVLGGVIATVAGRDIAKGGVMGAALGLICGAVFALLQASGVHS